MHTNRKQLKDAIANLRSRIQSLDKISTPDPIEWAERASGYSLDEWQRVLMTSTDTRELLLCSRQVGKTEGCALRAAYEVAFTPGATIAAIAPSQRQSVNLADRVRFVLLNSPVSLKFISLSRTEIVVEGGGRLLALPGDNPDRVRGLTLTRALIDEASFVRDSVMHVLLPMLAVTGGALTMLTTPHGPSGIFHEAWTSDEDWHRIKVLATECPRISHEFLAEARRKLGQQRYDQEYNCKFIQRDDAFFSASLIDQMFEHDDDLLPSPVTLPEWEDDSLPQSPIQL